MKAIRFENGEKVEFEVCTLDNNRLYDSLTKEPVDVFITTYNSVGGPKAKMMGWFEEDGFAYYDNIQTWYAAKDPESAWQDALMWAEAEDIPAIRGSV